MALPDLGRLTLCPTGGSQCEPCPPCANNGVATQQLPTRLSEAQRAVVQLALMHAQTLAQSPIAPLGHHNQYAEVVEAAERATGYLADCFDPLRASEAPNQPSSDGQTVVYVPVGANPPKAGVQPCVIGSILFAYDTRDAFYEVQFLDGEELRIGKGAGLLVAVPTDRAERLWSLCEEARSKAQSLAQDVQRELRAAIVPGSNVPAPLGAVAKRLVAPFRPDNPPPDVVAYKPTPIDAPRACRILQMPAPLTGDEFYHIRLVDGSELRVVRQSLFKLRYDPVFGHEDRWEDAQRLWKKPVPWL